MADDARSDDDDAAGDPDSRRRTIVLGVLFVVTLLVVTLVYFEPWSPLFDDDGDRVLPNGLTVDAEQAMRDAAKHDDEGSDPLEATGLVELSRGAFSGRSGQTVDAGDAVVYEGADGTRMVRIEGLDMTNGPALHVKLSTAPIDALSVEFGYDTVDLGPLVYNVGDSTYPIPPDVDVSNYRSVTIWCDDYDVNYAVAPIALRPPDTAPATTEAPA